MDNLLSGDQRFVRVDQRPLRTTIDAHHCQSTVRRMGQNLPGSSHDPRGHRSPCSPRHDPRNECRQLSPERSCRQSARSGTSADARDNQKLILIVAPRQSNHTRHENIACVITVPRQISSCRDRRNGHPDCRCVPIQIVALHRSRADQCSAPFSALFTLWLSIMAAVGLASRCSRSRHCS